MERLPLILEKVATRWLEARKPGQSSWAQITTLPPGEGPLKTLGFVANSLCFAVAFGAGSVPAPAAVNHSPVSHMLTQTLSGCFLIPCHYSSLR